MDNRIIKFRALYEGVWYYQTLEEMLTVTLAAFRLGKHKTQFTGLKDMEGNDIYEGDILESKSWGSSRSKNPYHVVKWGKVGWVALGYNGEMRVEPDLDVRRDFKIIGNLYQTPELLK